MELLLKNKFHYKKIFKVIVILAIAFFIFNIFFQTTAYAEGLLDYGKGDNPFNKITGSWGQFVNDKYRSNYSLDLGKVGSLDISDKAINSFTDVLFKGVMLVAWFGINIFNFCFDANISGKFAESLDKISNSLQNGVFDSFFIVFFMISLAAMVMYFIKRNYAALFTHFIGVILIAIMAIMINSKSAREFVIDTTNFSKEIGMTLIYSLGGEDIESNKTGIESIKAKNEDTKNNMIETLWGNLVHKPWVILEFNGKVSVDDGNKADAIEKSKKILSLSQKSEEREKFAEEEIGEISYTNRLGSTVILMLITLIKIVILILLGVIQIFLQILSNMMIIISPIILLLAIVPFFGGFNLIKWIGEKYLGIQITIVLLSFIIGALILIDKVLIEFFLGIGASFTVALLIQCVCWILIIVFRKQVVLNFTKLQRKVNGTIAAGSILGKGLDTTANAGNKAKEKVGAQVARTMEPVKRKAVDLKDGVGRSIKYGAKYTTGKAKIATARTVGNIIDKVSSKYSKSSNSDAAAEEDNNMKNNTNKNSGRDEKVVDIKEKLNNVKKKKESGNINTSRETVYERAKETELNKSNKAKENKPRENVNIKDKIKDTKYYENKEKYENKNEDKENIKTNEKKEEKPKVVNLNKARVVKGMEEVDDKELKNNLRKDLQKEYREEQKKRQEEKQIPRVEILKNKLGVSNSRIKEKERALNKELKKIKQTKQQKKKKIN